MCYLGQIILPPGGERLIFSNESIAKIEWSLEPSLSLASIVFRSWYFIRSGEAPKLLATINMDKQVMINTKLYEVDVEKPATLVLKNVNESYNGTYQFALSTTTGLHTSEVVVLVAGKFHFYIRACLYDPT